MKDDKQLQRELEPGFGYTTTPYRIEHRPTYGPHSRDELLRKLDLLAECGVQAWWYSVSSKGSYPLFPSRHLPYRDDAVDYLPWLAEQAHERGISLFSWEYLVTAPLVGAQHPEWRWRFFDWDGPSIVRDGFYICWNSPYGELLKHYCVEVVKDLGFDGIWFDGAFLFGHGASGTFACCCRFCSDKYRRQTGRDLPATIDLRDVRVREYMEWRYHDHVEYWRDLSAHVKREAPRAIIVFNYFHRLCVGIKNGSPLRRMAADAPQWPSRESRGPMAGMISAEVGNHPHQTMILGKILRAVNDNYPVELWGYGSDASDMHAPNPHPAPMLLHSRLCATIGAYPSIGCGRESMEDYRPFFGELSKRLNPIAQYVGGRPVAPVGLVVSGCSMDYGYVDDEHPVGRNIPAWRTVIGAHNLLNALRLQSEVLLDNMLDSSFLSAFSAIVLPQVSCMTPAAAEHLERYVEEGGILLAIGELPTRDELGRPLKRGVLDDLFDISWRDDVAGRVEISFGERLLGASGCRGLPPVYGFPAEARLALSESAETLAEGRRIDKAPFEYGAQGIIKPVNVCKVSGTAVMRRAVGRGQAYWIVPNIAAAYSEYGPSVYARLLVESLLSDVPRPFTAEAPPNVVVNMFRQDKRTVLHILNVPEPLLTLGTEDIPMTAVQQDAVPTGPVVVRISCPGSKAGSPTHSDELRVIEDGDYVVLRLEHVKQHAIIVLE